MSRIGKSEAQANAEALARRNATYADEHAASWQVRFDRPSHERRNLRQLVRDLRRAYEDEVPSRMHVHDVDGGGTPAQSPEMKAYLYGQAWATDLRDEGTTEVYLTPFRACLSSMLRSTDETTRQRSHIVSLVVVGGHGPVESAIARGVPDWCAKIVARDALEVFARRLTDVRLDLRTEKSVA